MKTLFTAGLLAFSATVWAHRPTTFDSEEVITDATFSWTLPGQFETGDELFTFELDFDTPFALPFEILVPTRGGNGDFRPAYAIVGPGLPEPTDDIRAVLPPDIIFDEGDGIFFEPNEDEDRYLYFEGVMRRALVSSGSTAVALEQGQFDVWIWSPDHETGNFMFGFGVEEDFSDGGFAGVFSNWSDFAY